MRKYGESKTTRIMMATVPHVISGLGLRKFQADGFLLTRVYMKFHYQVHKSIKIIPVMKQMSPLHTLSVYLGSTWILACHLSLGLHGVNTLLKIYHRLSACAFVLPVRITYIPKLITADLKRFMKYPSPYPVRNTIRKLVIKQFSAVSCYFVLLRSKYFP